MSTTSIGKIKLDLVVNKNDFQKQVSSINSLAKKTGTLLAAAFSIKKLVDFGQACLDLGSDLQEVQNVVDVTFPKMSEQVDTFAKDAAASFGLSETMAKKFSGTFGSMAKAFGFAEVQAYEMSTTLTGLAGDVASFYNLTQEEAYTKLKSVFTGETESLKDLGVVMTQSALDSYALAKGFGKTTSAMSEAEKVALRYAFVQEQLSAASGDFLRTSDGWANQIRVLQLRFDSLKATIGQGLINVLTPVVKLLNTMLAQLQAVADSFKSFTENLMGIDTSDVTSSVSSDLAAAASSSENLTNGLKNAAKAAKSMAGFDELNKLSDSKGVSTEAPDISSVSFEVTANKSSAEKTKSWLSSFFDELKVNIDFSKANASLMELKENLKPFKEDVAKGLLQFFTEVLVPLGTWTVNEVVPRFLETLANVIGVLNPMIEALQPLFQWFWDEMLAPLASWAGGTFLEAWDDLNESLKIFSNWCSENPGIVENMTTIIAAFFAAWKIIELLSFIETSGGVIAALKNIAQAITGTTLAKVADKIATMSLTVVHAKDFVVSLGKSTIALVAQAKQIWINIAAKYADEAAMSGVSVATVLWNSLMSSSITKMAIQAACWVKDTALKIANTAAQTAMTAATTAWTAVTTIATAVTTAFSAAIAFLTSPIGLVVVAIGALIAIGVLLYKNWDTVKEGILKAWEAIKNGITTAINAVSGVVSSVFNAISTRVSATMSNIRNSVGNIWNSIKTTVSSVVNAISTAVTSAFTRVSTSISGILNGIKNTFSNVFNALVSIVKKPINSIISILNALISGLNQISFDIPDWVPSIGGKSFGFNVPKIPMLANGGYVEKNTPQLAMIGDNRHQGEVVAPEGKMQEMADNAALKAIAALEDYMAAMMAGFEAVVQAIKDKDTNVIIGDEQIGKANGRYAAKMAVITGGT